MNFFFDNNLPRKFASALQVLTEKEKYTVEHLQDHFKENADDAYWIKELGKQKEKWIIISSDLGILKNLHEQEALTKSGCTYFVFNRPFQNKRFWDQITRIITIWPEIVSLAKENKTKAIFKIPYYGKNIERIK